MWSNNYSTLVYLLTLFTQGTKVVHSVGRLESSIDTDLGEWSGWTQCDNDSDLVGAVVGIRVNYDPVYQGPGIGSTFKDDVGVTGITLLCGSPHKVLTDEERVKGPKEIAGAGFYIDKQWSPNLFCSSFAIGLQLRYSTVPQKTQDHVEVMEVRLLCEDNQELRAGEEIGTFAPSMLCGIGEAVCGLRTRGVPLQSSSGSKTPTNDTLSSIVDNVGLTNAEISCCSYVADCIPRDEWVVTGEWDNSVGHKPLTISYKKKVGVGKRLESSTNAHSGSLEDGRVTPGFIVGLQKYLKVKFTSTLGSSNMTKYRWIENTAWQSESIKKMTVPIEPGHTMTAEQVVGFCGDYVIHSDEVRLTSKCVMKKNCPTSPQKLQANTSSESSKSKPAIKLLLILILIKSF